MSRSLARVTAALQAAGVATDIREMPGETRTANQAAAEAGCAPDQIVKSILFLGEASQRLHLFLTAGGQQVCPTRAATLAGEPLAKADAAVIRAHSGFAIGGVAPLGHLTEFPCYMDRHLLSFAQVWAAAGTPRHIFAIAPDVLLRVTGAKVADFTQ
ncbi:YbaK/EbsC family protein [Fertoebacter nigrum]|uniref:YbaK/EbsC family protein n=1 Tax=Fertoeibacter niger TaxID=2656921 RepID=A0A8X8GRJ0_9RHOB|nr:YbaK/EbsC family protein [Fertoeibacter niger]NUB43023.1 YbaK/EbsC family protein [Fertoeibacter niger]